MRPIYEPKGKAREYGDLAINIYTGCPHRCFYCFAPTVLRKDRETFHTIVQPRKYIVEEVRKQLEKEKITGKLVHLCFTCDPYPTGYDSTPTREIIQLLKESGNHAQILTKGSGRRDFDLLSKGDWYGVTFDGSDQPAREAVKISDLKEARNCGIYTWVSFEPVINADNVLRLMAELAFVDVMKIGKLNYHPSDIDWNWFGHKAEMSCKALGVEYYIKESLRECMH